MKCLAPGERPGTAGRRPAAERDGRGRRRAEEDVQVPDRVHRPRDRPATRLDRVVLRPGRRLQDRFLRVAGAGHLPRAAVVLGSGGHRSRARRRVADRERPGAGRRGRGAGRHRRGSRAIHCVDTSFTLRFKQLWNAPPNGLYGVEGSNGFVGAWEEGFLYGSAAIFLFVLAVGAFITVTMKTEAIQTGIGRLALRFRHSGSVLIAILMVGLRARRHDLRHVGGDARLLRPARPARARAQLRPNGRGGDHLPRRRHGRDRLDGQPVRNRRRLGRRRHQHRRRNRAAHRALGGARPARDRLRHLVRAARSGRTRRSRSSACRRPTPRRRRASSPTCPR